MANIITLIVLILASITDIKKRQIPNLLCFLFFSSGLVYASYSGNLGIKLICILLSLIFLWRHFWAPGDVKLYAGFILWQPLNVQPWFLLFFSLLSLIGKIKKQTNLPGAFLFLSSYLAVLILFHSFPLTIQLPGLGIHTILSIFQFN